MLTKPPRIPVGRWPGIVRILIGLTLGMGLLWFAVPRTVAAFLNLPGDPILAAIQTGDTVTSDQLDTFVSSREASLDWVSSGRGWTDLGLAYLSIAKQAGYYTENGIAHMSKSASALQAGLSKSPANPYAWARLTFLGLRLADKSIDTKHALVMSLLTGPFERRLVLSRIQYGLALWNKLDASQQDLIYDQIVFYDRFNHRGLIKFARQNRKYRTISMTALAGDPDRLAAFRVALKKK